VLYFTLNFMLASWYMMLPIASLITDHVILLSKRKNTKNLLLEKPIYNIRRFLIKCLVWLKYFTSKKSTAFFKDLAHLGVLYSPNNPNMVNKKEQWNL
jgi:hypothetical protein